MHSHNVIETIEHLCIVSCAYSPTEGTGGDVKKLSCAIVEHGIRYRKYRPWPITTIDVWSRRGFRSCWFETMRLWRGPPGEVHIRNDVLIDSCDKS